MNEDKDLNITTTNEVQADLVNLALQSLEQMTAKEIQPKYENALVDTEVEVLDISSINQDPVISPSTIENEVIRKKKKILPIFIIIFICIILFIIFFFYKMNY